MFWYSKWCQNWWSSHHWNWRVTLDLGVNTSALIPIPSRLKEPHCELIFWRTSLVLMLLLAEMSLYFAYVCKTIWVTKAWTKQGCSPESKSEVANLYWALFTAHREIRLRNDKGIIGLWKKYILLYKLKQNWEIFFDIVHCLFEGWAELHPKRQLDGPGGRC